MIKAMRPHWEEFDQLHAHAEPWLQPILTTAVLTGARLKEVIGLRWEHINRQSGLLYITEDNKTGVPRYVPISATLQKLFDEQPGGRFRRDGLVFTTVKGQPLTGLRERNRLSQRTLAAAKAAKLSGVSFHTLRHTAGSWMAQAGLSAVQIAKVLGHATTAMTDRYMHLSPKHLRDAVNALDAALSGADELQTNSDPSATVAVPEEVSAKLPPTQHFGPLAQG